MNQGYNEPETDFSVQRKEEETSAWITLSESDDNNGLILNNYHFPIEILVLILNFVDLNTLRKNCVLVCKKWRNLITHFVWKLKVERQRKIILPALNSKAYFYICLDNKFDINLISNPSGENKFIGWTIFNTGRDGWIVEDTPQGCEPLPESEFGENKKCFATSSRECTKMLQVDLLKYKAISELLDLQPHIYVCEWYGTHFDSACEYNLNVTLSDSGKCILKEFDFHFSEEQFKGGKWNKIEHTFKNYGRFCRYITFYHSGQGNSNQAGHCGVKLAGATVKVLLNSLGKNIENSEDEESNYCLLQKKGNGKIEIRRRTSYERDNPPNWFLRSEDECSD